MREVTHTEEVGEPVMGSPVDTAYRYNATGRSTARSAPAAAAAAAAPPTNYKITRSQNARRRRRTSHKSTGEGEAIGEAANEVDGEEIEWFYVRVVDPWRRSGES